MGGAGGSGGASFLGGYYSSPGVGMPKGGTAGLGMFGLRTYGQQGQGKGQQAPQQPVQPQAPKQPTPVCTTPQVSARKLGMLAQDVHAPYPSS